MISILFIANELRTNLSFTNFLTKTFLNFFTLFFNMEAACVKEVKKVLDILKEETGVTWSYEGVYCARTSWDFCPSAIATPERLKELTDKACEILKKHGYKVFNGFNIFYCSYAISVENVLIGYDLKCKFNCEGCPFAGGDYDVNKS